MSGLAELEAQKNSAPPLKVMFPDPVFAIVNEFKVKFPVLSLLTTRLPERVPVNARTVSMPLAGALGDQPGPVFHVVVPPVLLLLKLVTATSGNGAPSLAIPISARSLATTTRWTFKLFEGVDETACCLRTRLRYPPTRATPLAVPEEVLALNSSVFPAQVVLLSKGGASEFAGSTNRNVSSFDRSGTASQRMTIL